MKTQVGIVGAGPAGLTLSRLLDLNGISSFVIENKSRIHIESRIRAGVLEHCTMDLLNNIGIGERMMQQGMLHHGVELRFEGNGHRIDFTELTDQQIMVYGQQEIIKDLISAHLSESRPLLFEVSDVTLKNLESKSPSIHFIYNGESQVIECDIIAGCDGYHGISRPSIPKDILKIHEHSYPFGWLGILAEAEPSSKELIYASHDKGFALHSMRSSQLVRNYIQCVPEENINNWSDDRIWSELQIRMELSGGFSLNEGKIIEKSVTPMRGFLVEPMQYGNLYLAGDAAHIVPPTGAKGLNLAVKDVQVLSDALIEQYVNGNCSDLTAYTSNCLTHVWRAQYFSAWMTMLLHRYEDHDSYQRQLQLAQLRYITESRYAATSLAENYVGKY
ncbi:MAG: p-hydroxybenzoate 3-monooxygenase [Gammaproteobacteria bacterium]|jgi:p-hydroxybenzoate 3-monooxygenase